MKILILLFLIFSINTIAQNKEVISYYDNENIAVQKIKDSVLFYNSSGSLIRLIDLKLKKSISFGLPIEVQNIIFFGSIKKNRVDIDTFPMFLYTHANENASIVFCNKEIFYNDLGLKTGYLESCPDDTGGKDYLLGKKDLYQYNSFGQLTTIKGDTIREYDTNGNMTRYFRRNHFSGKIFNIYKYHYSDSKLIKKEDFDTEYENSILKSISRYEYDRKNRLKVIKNYSIYKGKEVLQSSFLFEYNSDNLILKVQEKKSYAKKNHTLLVYRYDENSKIKYSHTYPNKNLNYAYDAKGNLIKISEKSSIVRTFKYDATGRLIHIFNGSTEKIASFDYK